jgi:hypothetical protein
MRRDDLNVVSDLEPRLVILVRFEWLPLVDVIDHCVFEGMNVSPLGALIAFDLCIGRLES